MRYWVKQDNCRVNRPERVGYPVIGYDEVVLASDYDRLAKLVMALPNVSDEDIQRLVEAGRSIYAQVLLAKTLTEPMAALLRYRQEIHDEM